MWLDKYVPSRAKTSSKLERLSQIPAQPDYWRNRKPKRSFRIIRIINKSLNKYILLYYLDDSYSKKKKKEQ